MADNECKSKRIRQVFKIPEWYVMSKVEEDKLHGYILEASNANEANWFRFLDYAAFGREEFCFFCSTKAEGSSSA